METMNLKRFNLLKAVFEASPDMIAVTSRRNGTIIEVNEQFETQTGFTRVDAIGKTPTSLDMWPDIGRRDEFMAILARDGMVRDFRAKLRLRSGMIKIFQLSASIVEIGDDMTIVTVFRDVTEYSEAEEKIRKAAFLLERAEEMAKIGSWEFDYRSKLVTGSEGALRIYGVPQSGLTVDTIEKIPLLEYRSALNQARDEHIKNGKPYDIEFKICRQSDGQILDIHSKALWDPKNLQLFGILRDITDEKRTEAGLEQAIADRDALIRELYHRINNSLQTIVSLITLEEEQDQTKNLKDFGPKLVRRITAIANVHESLYESRSLSRIDMREFIPRLLKDIIEESGLIDLSAFDLAVERVDLNIDAAVPCGIILAELLDNAIKHAYGASKRGSIRLAVRRGVDRLVELVVSDQGDGVPFDMESLPESSLGLRLARSIALYQLKGSIFLRNTPGCECSIRFMDDHLVERV